jgi:hypothetical protein
LNFPQETPQVVVHGPGGKGYCLASKGFSSGCVQWKYAVLKETRGNIHFLPFFMEDCHLICYKTKLQSGNQALKFDLIDRQNFLAI